MIVRRRFWLYRMSGQQLIQSISFDSPVTAAKVRDALRRTVGIPIELWGRTGTDHLRFPS